MLRGAKGIFRILHIKRIRTSLDAEYIPSFADYNMTSRFLTCSVLMSGILMKYTK